jgi:hypothetical protein
VVVAGSGEFAVVVGDSVDVTDCAMEILGGSVGDVEVVSPVGVRTPAGP